LKGQYITINKNGGVKKPKAIKDFVKPIIPEKASLPFLTIE
jgi:hypothetical protein